MRYKFPVINNLSDVLPAIEGRKEFVVASKDGGYTVINYVVQTADLFPSVVTELDAIRRELRGIIFETKSGKILHRRLHKFFNANERDETQLHNIDFTQPHDILEKLDGSMITPVVTTEGIRWGTKMGVTDVALPVEEFVVDNPQYARLAEMCHADGVTPIFEWCSRKQTIVVDYPVDQLVLIAIRSNTHGTYEPYEVLQEVGAKWGIPVVKTYPGSVSSMEDLLANVRDIKGMEGYVLRFNDGHMVKVKAEDYLRKHRTKDAISREKDVVAMIVDEVADDVKSFMDPADRVRFEDFERRFWDGVTVTVDRIGGVWQVGTAGMDVANRRVLAVDFVLKQPRELHRFLFGIADGKDLFAMVVESIKNSTSTQTKLDEARWLFNVHWLPQIALEEE